MIIKSFEFYKFQIPLKFPLKIAKEELTFREGLILRVTDDKNNIGIGEISPLPGLHKENLLQTIKQLRSISSYLLNKEIPINLEQFNNGFDVWLKNFSLYPSLQFGIESAFLSLLAAQQRISVIDIFHSSLDKSVKINALLTGTPKLITKKINQYLAEGFTVFKIKVGRNAIDDDIKLVNAINKIIDGNAVLRLDANQTWTLDEALHFFQSIDMNNIEYIEEPLKNFEELPDLLKKKNIPIALDENILKFFNNQQLSPSQIKTFVIKPTVIGGVEKSIHLIKFAEENGINPVISDTFQSGIGLSTLIAIAQTIKNETAMGFDTYSWIEQDLLQNRFQIKQGRIFYDKISNFDSIIDYSKLQKL